MNETRVDMPQPGYYMIKRGYGFVPAVIEYNVPICPETGELLVERSGLWSARVDGKLIKDSNIDPDIAGVFEVWHGKKRKRIDKQEYESMLLRPQLPTIKMSPETALSIADKWDAIVIKNQQQADKCRDLAKELHNLEKTLDKERAIEKEPLLAQCRAVESEYAPRLSKLKVARQKLMDKLTNWAKKIKEDSLKQIPATAEMANGVAQSLPVVPVTVQIIGNSGGRAASLRTYRRAVLVDWDQACSTCRNDVDVINALVKRANAMLGSGIENLPGFEIQTKERVSL